MLVVILIFTLKMETPLSSKMLATHPTATQCKNHRSKPILTLHHDENLKSVTV